MAATANEVDSVVAVHFSKVRVLEQELAHRSGVNRRASLEQIVLAGRTTSHSEYAGGLADAYEDAEYDVGRLVPGAGNLRKELKRLALLWAQNSRTYRHKAERAADLLGSRYRGRAEGYSKAVQVVAEAF